MGGEDNRYAATKNPSTQKHTCQIVGCLKSFGDTSGAATKPKNMPVAASRALDFKE